MTEFVDEEDEIKFEIKTKPNKNGHSTIKKLLAFLRNGRFSETSKPNEEVIEVIKTWDNIIHSRDETEVELCIKTIRRKKKSQVVSHND
tara:strand:+ start:970 stop:1236 length:267 start_codon:yes stop_codon:yes gene_type:complete